MVKLLEGSKNQKLVTVPRELFKAMPWEAGDDLEWSVVDENTLQLTKK